MKKVILGMAFMAVMSFSLSVSAQMDGKDKKESKKTEQCCTKDKDAKTCSQKKDADKKCCNEKKAECPKKDAKDKK
ncbi:MAG: hypothetical protein LBF05_08045 [Tannerella sp.]|jgi:hypothetical protein|nr:hypothetical protein [Tannerella sp.]